MERADKYAQAALANACTAISSALAGTRNHVLNNEAFSIGQLVGSGIIGFTEARSALLDAAKQNKVERHEAEATIDSGLRGGMKNPRDVTTLNGHDDSVPIAPRPKKTTSDYARDLYREAVPMQGTLGERYLREHRGIDGPLPDNFRFHPNVWHKGAGNKLPAMLAPITRTDDTGSRINAVHITFLDPATGAKSKADPAKKMYGSCRHGGIWLGEYAAHMLCAEGIEKGLACQSATGISAAVGLSATLLPSIIWPRGTKKITLCADPNGAGESAIHKAARNLATDGIELLVCYPPLTGSDWDETQPEEIREAIEAAKSWQAPKARPVDISAGAASDDFERNDAGQILKNEGNILRALECSGVELRYDEFGMEYHVTGLEGYGPDLSKAAREELFLVMQREHRFKPGWDDFRMVIDSAARRNRFHPVREYLNSLEWDGTDRIDEWLIAHAGSPDTPFVRAVSRIVLIAAVRRIRRPGCKFDEMLVLESPEGRNKSTAFAILAGDGWFSDDAPLTANPREVIERLRGRWIVECADLSGMTRAEIEEMKAFLSRREDAAALKYDPDTTKRRRSCIFVGTTNRSNYLISDTGNRRFWPVSISNIDIETLARDRDQLWAEAAYWEAQGESIRLAPSLYADAREEQESRRVIDPWRDKIEHVFGDVEGKIACDEVWAIIEKPMGQRTQHDNNRLGSAMRDCGWERKKLWLKSKKSWCYARGGPLFPRIELWKEGDAMRAVARPDDMFDGDE